MGIVQPEKPTMGEVRHMATFVDKVRLGGGLRFDPLLEEKWVGVDSW